MDTISRESNGSSFLPFAGIILGALGALLGGVALAKLGTANKTIAAHEEKLAKVDALDADVSKALAASDKETKDLASLGRQTQDAFNSVGTELGNLRTEITKLAEARKPAAVAKGEKGAAVATGVVSEDGTYAIAAGDTLARVAKKLGVSLEAIQSVNPGVDAKHLRVGPKIKVPKK